jgi:hypothetical protein
VKLCDFVHCRKDRIPLKGDGGACEYLDPLHQVCDEASDFVPQLLGRDLRDLITDTLVRVEVKRQTSVVSAQACPH